MTMSHPETCAEIQAALPLLAGDDLEPRALAEARRHLEACAPCARSLEAARGARAMLGTLRVDRPGPDLWPGVRNRLREEGLCAPAPGLSPGQPVGLEPAPEPVAAERAARGRLHRWRRPQRVAAAAALLACASGAGWLWAGGPWGGGAAPAPGPGAVAQTPGAEGSTAGARPGAEPGPLHDPGPAALPPRGQRDVRLATGGGVLPGPRATRAALQEADCVDPWGADAGSLAGETGAQALRPSADQVPRHAVPFQPDGWQGEPVDLRPLRLGLQPRRAGAGVSTVGGPE